MKTENYSDWECIADVGHNSADLYLMRSPEGLYAVKEERWARAGRVIHVDEKSSCLPSGELEALGYQVEIVHEITAAEAAQWCLEHLVPACLHAEFSK